MSYFNKQTKDIVTELESDLQTGLSSSKIEDLQKKYGKNEFTPPPQTSIWAEILDSLKETMIVILLIAAAVSTLIGEVSEGIGIVCAVALGIAIGLITEGKSKKAADALSKMTKNIVVKVLRDSKVTQISKSELVVGDIILFETGDMVPADARLIETIDLKVREDMLTGESDDVSKIASVLVDYDVLQKDGQEVKQDPIPAKQINMVFGGTMVAYGRGKAIVTSIGDNTEMGKIAANLVEEDDETPLQAKLGDLGTKISKISSIVAGLIFIIIFTKLVLAKAINVDMTGFLPFLNSVEPVKTAFITCIALIVAAVPEGLPTMISMTLAITMQRMAKINALVTKKEACETIGSVSVICSDKTGTLTQNKMMVEKVYLRGKFINEKSDNDGHFIDNCLLNSTADIEIDGATTKYLGSATECALLLHNRDFNYVDYRNSKKIVHQVPFTSKTKKMTTVVEDGGKYVMLSKGAPEVILGVCTHELTDDGIVTITDSRLAEINSEIQKLQEQSMRVIGFAYKAINEEVKSDNEYVDDNLVFTGFVGIMDPLREDVKDAVAQAKAAGVETKMLTGDNINTAIAIGNELGLLDGGKIAVEATYIDTLTDEQLRKEINNIGIIARSKPDTKMKVVQALQTNGEVVAMTGDGINDAPALTKADVGIAMGISGTEVSKGAADIILVDDSFSTIVKAIKWGRGTYENFQRFIQFQMTVNIIAFVIAILSVIFDFEMPFTTIQLLWVNIIMDGPPALALGLEPVRDIVLKRKPVNRKASIITKSMIKAMILNALFGVALLLVQMKFNILGASTVDLGGGVSEMETALFSLFAITSLFNAFNCREFGLDSILPNFASNKIALQIITVTGLVQILLIQYVSGFFNATPLSLVMWGKIIALSFSIIVVNEIVKMFARMFKK